MNIINFFNYNLFPLISGTMSGSAIRELRLDAPAPSVTIFSSSAKCNTALEIQSSLTRTFNDLKSN